MQSNVSFVTRIWAIIYDTLLVFSLIFAIGLIVQAVFGDLGNVFFYVVTLPTSYIYFSQSWTKGRQTLGMKALKFQIVQQNGENITHKQALTRLFCAAITLIFIGHLYMFFNDDNLSLQDKISKTLFVKN
tara:strand:- start:2009 stop:2398 length:390 start_codon:yes stop_codon:yes gene_type:complete